MKFITKNTKDGKEYTYNENEVEKLFMCDSFNENHILKSDLNEYLENISDYIYEDEDEDEAKEEYIKYWEQRYIHETVKEYLTEMIEYEKWTSPRGVESVFEVIEIEE
jgi:hypothetical protein